MFFLIKKAVLRKYSQEKVFWKHAANLQENTLVTMSKFKFHLKQTILNFWTKVTQKSYFQSNWHCGISLGTKFQLKDTHREYTPSKKTKVLRKSMNVYIWAIGTLIQLFIRGSCTQIKFSEKWRSQWKNYILCNRSILYSLFNFS